MICRRRDKHPLGCSGSNEVIWMSELLDNIRSRGYWKIIIHPSEFVQDRVADISELYPILNRTSVHLRGWDFPHLSASMEPKRRNDSIEGHYVRKPFLEVWRFYQSGQFVDISSAPYDWEESSRGRIINVADCVYRLTEAFEFAARLSLTKAGGEFMHIEITHENLTGRGLDFKGTGNVGKGLTSRADDFFFEQDVSQIELLTEPLELALEPATNLFRQFGWEPHFDFLREIQSQLRLPKPR